MVFLFLPVMKLMFCGANDTAQFYESYIKVTREFGATIRNFSGADLDYDNYHNNNWEMNSIRTVSSCDIIIFVVNKLYGKITWETEFKEVLSNYKNFIILCEKSTYESYRNHNALLNEKQNDVLIHLFQQLESNHQVTLIPFENNKENFENKLKENLLLVFSLALKAKEIENKKNTFLPILYSSRMNDIEYIKDKVSSENDKLCKEILFDSFQEKQIRKKALDYFMVSKSLNDDEIVELCLDSEQGISRKTIESLTRLVNTSSNLDFIFEEVIPSIANEEVGVVRRAITSFFDLDLARSIQNFYHFLPANDVGTPKRIILELSNRFEKIKGVFSTEPKLTQQFTDLILLCLDYSYDKAKWKEIGKELLNTIENNE